MEQDCNQLEFFQFDKAVTDFTNLEWAQIRKLARECVDNKLHDGDTMRCIIEAYFRFVATCESNQTLFAEINGNIRPNLH